MVFTDASGAIVYAGFPADVLWKFRWYSLLDQLMIWTLVGVIFGDQVERVLRREGVFRAPTPAGRKVASPEPVLIST